jgi:hypothetical protein
VHRSVAAHFISLVITLHFNLYAPNIQAATGRKPAVFLNQPIMIRTALSKVTTSFVCGAGILAVGVPMGLYLLGLAANEAFGGVIERSSRGRRTSSSDTAESCSPPIHPVPLPMPIRLA